MIDASDTAPERTGHSKIHAARQFILQRVLSGRYAVGSRIPPEAELITELGYSRSTIREAVSSLVHDGLLERRQGSGTYVLSNRPMDDAGYLAMRQSLRIGMVVPSRYVVGPSPFMLRVVRALSRPQPGMPAIEVRLLVAEPDYRGVGQLHVLDAVEHKLVDAVVMTIAPPTPADLDVLAAQNVPLVFLSGPPEDDHYRHSRVWTDLSAGVAKAVTYLNLAGREQIGLILGRRGGYTASEFLAGAVRAQVRLGQTHNVSRVRYVEDDAGLIPQALRELVAEGADALLCCDDETALVCLRVLKELNLKVPGEVAVLGANDTSGDPTLATLALPFDQIGQALLDILCHALTSSRASVRQQSFMPHLLVRASVPLLPRESTTALAGEEVATA